MIYVEAVMGRARVMDFCRCRVWWYDGEIEVVRLGNSSLGFMVVWIWDFTVVRYWWLRVGLVGEGAMEVRVASDGREGTALGIVFGGGRELGDRW
ncbi:hypothetical protein M0R45_032035 [Rubus argutus]|uniref:Uncharacterized protein n=1 Tax=Rubus argutus TaxID=59490 RepID=A0AAW1WJW6_RUBAR